MTIFLPLFSAIGILLAGLAVPLIRRRVKPNRIYGLRTPATFADEGVWYEANVRSGWDLAVLGVLQIVAAIGLSMAPLGETAYALANAAFLAVGSITLAIVGWRRANSLLAAR